MTLFLVGILLVVALLDMLGLVLLTHHEWERMKRESDTLQSRIDLDDAMARRFAALESGQTKLTDRVAKVAMQAGLEKP